MNGNQHSVASTTEYCANDKPSENKASEPTIIAEQHRSESATPKNMAGNAVAGTPPAAPEQPANPHPSQQPQYPADPMDPSDPNGPNPIEGGREELFPTEPAKQPPNE